MSIAAGKSAEENRWIKFSEVAASVKCDEDGCMIVDLDEDELAAASEGGTWIGGALKNMLPKEKKGLFSR